MFKNIFASTCVIYAVQANQELETYRLLQQLEQQQGYGQQDNSFFGTMAEYANKFHHYASPMAEWHDPMGAGHHAPVHHDYTVDHGYEYLAQKQQDKQMRKEMKREDKEERRMEKDARKEERREMKRERKAEKHAMKYGDLGDIHSFADYPDYGHEFAHPVHHPTPVHDMHTPAHAVHGHDMHG